MPRTNDKIILSDLTFYGYHGVMKEETSLGQRFHIDLECGVDLRRSGNSDNVDDTISYDQIFNQVNNTFNATRFKLIEALAEHIADQLMDSFSTIEWVRVRVRKPQAPVPVVAGEFSVEIVRDRDQR